MNHFDKKPLDLEELVVNWHILEACNYRCRYCYAKWFDHKVKEIWRDAPATQELLSNLWAFFGEPASSSGGLEAVRWRSTRLSLAGGEPTLLGNRLVAIVKEARHLGFDVSIITNGSRLEDSLLESLAPDLFILGLSIDSIDPATNGIIGRSRRDKSLALNDFVAIVTRARALNPDLKIKINTVVNAANEAEDLSPLMEAVRPDKWKVLQMLPVITSDLATGKRAYEAFLGRHAAFSSIMRPEGNEEITQSYIMVDPLGRFFQNAAGGSGYIYSAPINEVGAARAFDEVPFQSSKFAARYECTNDVEAG